jgi:hypothetical protein
VLHEENVTATRYLHSFWPLVQSTQMNDKKNQLQYEFQIPSTAVGTRAGSSETNIRKKSKHPKMLESNLI